MSDLAIRAEGLGKRYRLGAPPAALLREQVAAWARLLRGRRPPAVSTLWALQDVGFDVRRGEVVSLIGRNGAGKSTLLKILSRVVEPTTGRAEIIGRLGSLLEVGTGFHPELSGRENVFLNAAILGMRRADIAQRFDDIVAFAEMERFIDTPVKRYSSGMYLRLAFAVAAHLDPDILVIDEVLAVGDAAFQRRCLGKIDSVARQGRTVVFVSHDMSTVTSLARRALLLDGGRLVQDGPAADVVRRHLEVMAADRPRAERRLEVAADLPLAITGVQTTGLHGEATAVVARSSALVLVLEGVVRRPVAEPDEYFVALDVYAADGVRLFRTHNVEARWFAAVPRETGPFRLSCTVPAELLIPGTYRLGLVTGVAGRGHLQEEYPVLEVDVVQDKLLADTWTGHAGLLTPRCDWKLVTGTSELAA
jgi:lipopolysaccharide transport system ATP-binding protein